MRAQRRANLKRFPLRGSRRGNTGCRSGHETRIIDLSREPSRRTEGSARKGARILIIWVRLFCDDGEMRRHKGLAQSRRAAEGAQPRASRRGGRRPSRPAPERLVMRVSLRLCASARESPVVPLDLVPGGWAASSFAGDASTVAAQLRYRGCSQPLDFTHDTSRPERAAP